MLRKQSQHQESPVRNVTSKVPLDSPPDFVPRSHTHRHGAAAAAAASTEVEDPLNDVQ